MPSNDGQAQSTKQSSSSSTKKTDSPPISDPTPILIHPDRQGQSVQMTEDDFEIGEDTYTSSPRPSNSTVIRNKGNLPAPSRTTDTQASSGVPRRSSLAQPGAGTNILPPTTPRSPRNTTIVPPIKTGVKIKGQGRRNVHWLVLVGVGMIAMLALWVIGTAIVGWAQGISDDLHYGKPRTFQIDAIVGHGGDSQKHPTHFIAVNLNRNILIIELPAGSPACAVSYGGPYVISGDLVPVTLEFKDDNHNGKPNMYVHIEGQVIEFINNGTVFIPSGSNTASPPHSNCTVTSTP